jgi:hypothetical protein
MSSHADIAVNERPCLKQLSGRWTLDITQSESNDGVLAAMGCGFITRALLARLETRIELWQSPSSLLIRESTVLGTYHSRELVTDGRWHEVAQLGGGLASVRATLSPTTGDVSIESSLSSGLLIEHFSLMRRIALGHVRDFFPGCAEVTAEMVPSASAVGVWTRDETDAERLAAEEAEAAAVQAAGVSAISLTLGYTAENGDENANVNKKKVPMIEKSHEENGPLSPPLSDVEEADFIPNFTGAWGVDTAASRDTLESILYLMGVPWLAVKVALSLNVITVITHDVEGGNVTTEERTSLGVIARNTLHTDGITVPQKGADGRTAHITCTARAATPAEKIAGTLGALRIITELPDGLGTTDNTWFLRVNGLEMYQEISFTRGAKTVEAQRVLVNRSTPPIAQREMQQKSSRLSLPISLDSSYRTPITNDTVLTVLGDDPFFVSLQGIWGGVGTAISDLARDLSANNSRGAATAANTLRRFATTETNKNLVIDHNHTSITFKNGPIGALMGILPIPLDSKWQNGVRAYTIMGHARDKTWLGYEAMDLPSTDAPPFFLSSLPCESAAYTRAHIIIEKEIVAGGANKPWVLLMTIALIIPQLRIEFSIADSSEGRGGGGSATAVAMMSLNMPVDDVRAYVKEAGVRARHCRALIVARRGEADRRNAAALIK